jgi:hypothetical protein
MIRIGVNVDDYSLITPLTWDESRIIFGEILEQKETVMAEVRFNVDDQFLANLQKSLGTTKTTDVVKEALTVLNWAVTEKSKGRQILSGDADASNLVRLATPGLDSVKEPGAA